MIAAQARRCYASLTFNGHNVTERIKNYITTVTHTDVVCGSSDSINIDMYNADLRWLDEWFPTKGDEVTGGFLFVNWNRMDEKLMMWFGTQILDSIRASGGPSRITLGTMAIPQDQSFKTRQRTKTWENVTLQQIATEIAGRYGLTCQYSGKSHLIDSLEQTDKTDSDFLYSTVKEYGLKMKVYNKKIVIFDMGRLEAKAPVRTISRSDWVNDGWDFDDELEGTYTGAIIGYKSDSGKDEIKVKVGNANEDSPKARVLYVNKKCDSQAEAMEKAAAAVNEANETMTTLKGTIWADPTISSGVTVTVTELGKASGKYLIDKVTTSLAESGTKQTIEMHKCYKRL